MSAFGEDTPHVLVEGGPVHRHLSRWLAVLTGLLIGVLPVLGYTAVEALKASGDIQASRHQACVKANDRHAQAKVFLDRLVAATPKPPTPPSKTEQAVKDRQVHLFLEAIAPKYDCRTF